MINGSRHDWIAKPDEDNKVEGPYWDSENEICSREMRDSSGNKIHSRWERDIQFNVSTVKTKIEINAIKQRPKRGSDQILNRNDVN